MSKEVNWTKDFDQAFETAQTENKAVLLDFFNPE